MKIKDCAVIDIEALQLTIKMLELSKLSDMQTKIDTNNVNIVIKTLEEIIKKTKSLEPIVRDAVDFAYYNSDLWEGFDEYINETEI